MSRCVLSTRNPHSAPPHRRRLHVQASTGLAPTPLDKMPARFRYSPNASPRPCRDACLARAPHSAPPHSNAQETPAYASTGLAPTPPDEMPASRFRNSPNASPRSCRDACLARAPPTAHRRTGDACTYRPVMAFQPRTRCPEHSASSAQIMWNSPPMVTRSGASATRPGRRVTRRSREAPASSSMTLWDTWSSGSEGSLGVVRELF
jgi:hypothetical protein